MSSAKSVVGYSSGENVWDFSHADAEVVLANISDFGTEDSNEEAVANLVVAWKPDAIFTNGDNSQADNDYDDDVDYYYGSFVDRGIFFPCPGNHDWDDGTLAAYFDYFSPVIGRKYYYKKQVGPLTLFMLDGNSVTPDGNTDDSYQGEWFAEQAEWCNTPWKVACIHQPPYSSSSVHGSTADSQWDFSEMDVVFSGHDHLYERLVVDGVNYVVNGLGGQTKYSFAAEAVDGSVVRYNSAHGAGRLIATPTKLVWEFWNVYGALIDTFTLEK